MKSKGTFKKEYEKLSNLPVSQYKLHPNADVLRDEEKEVQ